MINNDKQLQEEVRQNELEFNKQYDELNRIESEYLNEEIQQESKDRIDFMCEVFLKMNEDEKTYLRYIVSSDLSSLVGVDIMSLRSDLPLFREMFESPSYYLNENGRRQQQTCDEEGRSLEQIFPQFGAASQNQQTQQTEQVQPLQSETTQQEVKKEQKTNFDIELTSYDPANKIKIIKEVRTILNLGLKEAKDLVDKVPSILQKQAVKEDADKIQILLQTLSCVITLK